LISSIASAITRTLPTTAGKVPHQQRQNRL
jgi:hypothetical protein